MKNASENSKDSYGVDISTISIDEFREMLKGARLLPGRRVLLEDIDARFEELKRAGTRDLKELYGLLVSKKGMKVLQERTGITGEYLTVLRREIGGLFPRPAHLAAIPGVDPSHLKLLASVGITDTRRLLDAGRSCTARKELSKRTDIPLDVIDDFTSISDLIRVNGVGPVFARMLLDAGIGSVAKIVDTPAAELLDQHIALNGKGRYTEVKLAIGDVEFCVRNARRLPLVIDVDMPR